jgi:hypothetical protein
LGGIVAGRSFWIWGQGFSSIDRRGHAVSWFLRLPTVFSSMTPEVEEHLVPNDPCKNYDLGKMRRYGSVFVFYDSRSSGLHID